MDRKRTIWIIIVAVLAVLVIWLALSLGSLYMGEPNPAPVPTQTPQPVEEEDISKDKTSSTIHAGVLTEISGDVITLLVDGAEEYNYTLSERAKRELTSLKINVGDDVLVNFERLENDELSAVSLEKIISQ